MFPLHFSVDRAPPPEALLTALRTEIHLGLPTVRRCHGQRAFALPFFLVTSMGRAWGAPSLRLSCAGRADVASTGLDRGFGNAPLGTMQCTQGNAPQGMHQHHGTTTLLYWCCCCCCCALRPPSLHHHLLQVLLLIFIGDFVFIANFVAALALTLPQKSAAEEPGSEDRTVECAKVWP